MRIPQPECVKVPQNLTGMSYWKQFIYSFGNPPNFMFTEDLIADLDLKYDIIEPKGFVTDFVSVPRPFWPLISPNGPLMLGSIFHDHIYQYGYLLTKYDPNNRYPENSMLAKETYPEAFVDLIPVYIGYTRFMADVLLKTITEVTSGATLEADAGFAAVQLGGEKAWNSYRKYGNGYAGPAAYNKNSLNLPGIYK